MPPKRTDRGDERAQAVGARDRRRPRGTEEGVSAGRTADEAQRTSAKKAYLERHDTSFSPRQHGGDSSATSSAPAPVAPRLYHPFKANFNDHFETSLEALQDVLPAVSELRQLTRPFTPELFTLYDPYYCFGTIVSVWGSLGYEKVLHENRDFYADIESGTVPGPYDMLVTNPPFSDDHVLRMMRFLIGQSKPWAFLAPDYVAAKPWYRALIKKHFTEALPTGKGDINAPRGVRAPAPAAALTPPPFLLARLAASAENPAAVGEASALESGSSSPAAASSIGPEPFYVVPRTRYDFKHPTGAGNAHSHFKSMWYVWAGRRTAEVVRAAKVTLLSRNVTVVHGVQALDESKLVSATERRPNPQQRTVQKQQRQSRWR